MCTGLSHFAHFDPKNIGKVNKSMCNNRVRVYNHTKRSDALLEENIDQVLQVITHQLTSLSNYLKIC